jgi:hypothetical protein
MNLTVRSYSSQVGNLKIKILTPLLEVATQAILQQVMNHRDAGIFQTYLNERVSCDVQAAFLGRPSADALIKATSHMSRFVDPRAPVGLTESQVNGSQD